MKDFKKRGGKPSASFVVGSVALLFLIIGYQAALFISKASVARIVANHDHPDTVFFYLDSLDSVATLRSEAGSGRPASSALFSDSMESDLSADAGGAVELRPYSAAAKRGWTRPGSSGWPALKAE